METVRIFHLVVRRRSAVKCSVSNGKGNTREKYKIRLLSWLLAAGQSRHEVDVNPVTEIVGQTTLTWCWCVCVCVKYLLHQFKICVHSSPAAWRRKAEEGKEKEKQGSIIS